MTQMPDEQANRAGNRLSDQFSELASTTRYHYLTLANSLQQKISGRDRPLLLGVSGAQGTGKTTLCAFLSQHLENRFALRSVVLSLDDFYLTKSERQQLAQRIHPLLATRGVPGTHDLKLLNDVLHRLLFCSAEERVVVPAFDKLADDRLPEAEWRNCCGKPDLVILEGWCVGAESESRTDLLQPVNSLEMEKDPDGSWRQWVNQQLEGGYQTLFQRLDGLVFLQVPGLMQADKRLPNMEQIVQWRLEQEEQLIKTARQPGMPLSAIRRFVMYYERITRTMQQRLPGSADVVLTLNRRHEVIAIHGSVWFNA